MLLSQQRAPRSWQVSRQVKEVTCPCNQSVVGAGEQVGRWIARGLYRSLRSWSCVCVWQIQARVLCDCDKGLAEPLPMLCWWVHPPHFALPGTQSHSCYWSHYSLPISNPWGLTDPKKPRAEITHPNNYSIVWKWSLHPSPFMCVLSSYL